MARLLSAEAAWKAAEACFTTFGGFAFASEYDIERKWRDARLGPDCANFAQPHLELHRAARTWSAEVVLMQVTADLAGWIART